MTDLRHDAAGLPGVRRILQDWIAAAGDSLHKKRVTDVHIHDARKQLKKARAALRLLRDGIGPSAYRRENTALRDAARPLGVARDSKVLIAALDELVEHHAPASQALKLDRFRRVLRKEQAAARQAITATLINEQRKALSEASSRVERWRMSGEPWHVIGGGIERVYRGGKKAMQAAAASRTSEDLHAWRKQVKYLWHQLQILEPAWPALLGELAAQAHKLADQLGDDHDLAVLRGKISGNAAAFDTQDRDALVALLDRRRKQLQDRAFRLGARMYAEKPRRFRGRVASYWRLWRAE
ncbi:MAG: CHAD domain-containing protein [Pseudomonadota bacterium]|nr:CHAD domain-containing protein [Pseudomonadota bacterium]